MPPSSPTFVEELKVPRRASMADSTRLTIKLKSTKYQYSLRLDLPPNTAYFLSASRYQLIRKPPKHYAPPPEHRPPPPRKSQPPTRPAASALSRRGRFRPTCSRSAGTSRVLLWGRYPRGSAPDEFPCQRLYLLRSRKA